MTSSIIFVLNITISLIFLDKTLNMNMKQFMNAGFCDAVLTDCDVTMHIFTDRKYVVYQSIANQTNKNHNVEHSSFHSWPRPIFSHFAYSLGLGQLRKVSVRDRIRLE